jgi:transposase
MKEYHYIGLDVHKQVIAFCIKSAGGEIVSEGSVAATRPALLEWAAGLPKPWMGAMEATLFSGWIYDFLLPHAASLKVGHSYMLKAICASKKKNDRLDARKLADALRCDLLPECYMARSELRELRQALRYRHLLVREAVRLKNKTAGLLMEAGAEYEKDRLHGRRYFEALLGDLDYVPASVVSLLRFNEESMRLFEAQGRRLVRALQNHDLLRERVARLMSIRGVGEVTALTWALEIGEAGRFRTVKQAVSYCGLCSGQSESAGKTRRGPLSKQRNKHLQHVLIEAAKLAPRWNLALRAVYQNKRARGANANQATVAVARKLAAYLLAVDKSGREFEPRENRPIIN